MWVDLEDDEIAQIVAALGLGPIQEKLTAKQHPDAEKFREEAEFFSDYVTLPMDAPIERTRNGAYVLTWTWVYNETAGYMALTNFDDFEISDVLRNQLEELREFQVDFLDLDHKEISCGAIDKWRWAVSNVDGRLMFAIKQGDAGDAVWSHTAQHQDRTLDEEAAFSFILDAATKFRHETSAIMYRQRQ